LPYIPPGLVLKNCILFPHRAFVCSVWILEQMAVISLCSIKWLVFI